MDQSILPLFPLQVTSVSREPRQKIPVYCIKLVKHSDLSLGQSIHQPNDAGRVALEYLRDVDREHFIVLMLNTKLRVIGINTASIGTLEQGAIHPREVFKPAILSNSSSIIVAHNHPSDDLTPSPQDLRLTQYLVRTGEVLGIPVLDHLILGFDSYRSLRETQPGLFGE